MKDWFSTSESTKGGSMERVWGLTGKRLRDALIRTVSIAMCFFVIGDGRCATDHEEPGARVDESNLVSIFVSPLKGDDKNDGLEGHPVASVKAGLRIAEEFLKKGQGARVVLQAGIYRETGAGIDGEKLGDSARQATLVIEAEYPGSADWRGSMVRRDWVPVGAPQERVFRTSWISVFQAPHVPPTMEETSIPNRLGRRSEMVFVNGILQRQVDSRVELGAGCYWVEDKLTDQPGHGAIYLCPMQSQDISSSEIEVSGDQSEVPLLSIKKKANVVLRGISFSQSGNVPWNFGAVQFIYCENVLIEDNSFIWNNSDGLFVGEIAGLTVGRNRLCHNGGSGGNAPAGERHLWEDNHFDHNAWRAHGLGGELAWYHAGLKTGFGLRNAVFVRNTFLDNEAIGFWLDTDAENIRMEDLEISDNRRAGMWWEASHGPGLLRNSRISQNSMNGLLIGDAGGISVENCRIVDNFPAQVVIAVSSQNGKSGREVKDRDDQTVYQSGPDNIRFKGNIIAAIRPNQTLFNFEWDGKEGRQLFLNTVVSSDNVYWHPARSDVFASPIGRAFLKLNFDQWKALLNAKRSSPNEVNSRWAPPPPIAPEEKTTK